jgi:hypothetical protein
MLRKSTLLAVAATAALGLAMLNPTAASAGHGGGFGGGHGGGMHGGGHGGGPGGGHGGGMHGGWGSHGGGIHIGFRPYHHHPRWQVRYHRPIWYAPRPVIYSAYSPRVVSPGPCTCLSKEYTPDGAVLFKDRCTNEAAINPPPAPQQTGALEPQVQPYSQQYVQPQPQAK